MTLAHRSQNKISCRSSFGTTARRETPANEPCWLSGPLKPPRLAHPRSRSTPFVGLPWSMAVPWDGHFDSVLHARAQSPPAATEGQRAVSRAFAKQERMAVQARRARCNSPRALRQRPAQPPSSEAHGRVDHRRVTAMSEEALVASRRRAAERSRTSASSCAPRAPRQAWQDPSPLDRPLEEHDPCKSRNVSDHVRDCAHGLFCMLRADHMLLFARACICILRRHGSRRSRASASHNGWQRR